MKRLIAILSVVILTIGTIGCHSFEEQPFLYNVWVNDFSDAIPELQLTVEYDMEDQESYADIKAPANVIHTIHGDTVNMQYRRTMVGSMDYKPIYKYYDGIGNGITRDVYGNIVGFSYQWSDEAGEIISAEEAVEIAKAFVAEKVDLAPYRVTVEDLLSEYYVTLQKYIGEYKAADKATISISKHGIIRSYSGYLLGAVPTGLDVGAFDTEAIKAAVYARLDSSFAAIKAEADVEYAEPDITIAALKDGSFGAIADVSVKCTWAMGEAKLVQSELVRFVVVPS